MNTSAFLTSGPMGRSVRDMRALLDVIAGPDGHDPFVRRWHLRRWQAEDLRGVVVYPVESNGATPVEPSLRREVRRAADALAARGAEIRELPAHRLGQSFAIWARAMEEASAGGPSFAEILGDGRPISLAGEVARTLVGRARVTAPALGLALLERAAALLPAGLTGRIPARDLVRRELEDALGDTGVILYPPYTRPAPLHARALLRPLDFVYTGILSILELPVTQVPTGFDARRLPLGVQVVARRGGDGLTLAVAEALEQELGGWIPAEPGR